MRIIPAKQPPPAVEPRTVRLGPDVWRDLDEVAAREGQSANVALGYLLAFALKEYARGKK